MLTVKVRATGSKSFDELFRSYDPSESPARKSATLGQTVDDKDVIPVNILDIVRRADNTTVAIRRVVVP